METIKQDEMTINYPKSIWNMYHAEVKIRKFNLSDDVHYIVKLHCEIGEMEDWNTDIRISREFVNKEEKARKLYKQWRKIYVKDVRKLTNLYDLDDTEFWDDYKSSLKEIADSLL